MKSAAMQPPAGESPAPVAHGANARRALRAFNSVDQFNNFAAASADNGRMQNRRNYYRILHVQRDAPTAIIKTSYRTLMQRLKMHPDLGGDHWNASLINEAYATLSDPERRADYDKSLEGPVGDSSADRQPEPAHKTSADDCAEPNMGNGWQRANSGKCPFCRTPHRQKTLLKESCCEHCSSPLFPPPQSTPVEPGTRAIERMQKSLPATVYFDWPTLKAAKGITLDLSPNGMRFVSEIRIPIGTIVRIDCEICTAVGRVRNCIDDALCRHCGIQFLTLKFKAVHGNFVSVEA